jgi:ADP-L-glycero-D-manno-heptose 6-epimerase
MASVAFHHYHQFRNGGRVQLFEGSHGFENGEQRRDFIHVDDVVAANVHFLNKPVSGVYNLGSGRAQSFNDVALAVVNTMRRLAKQQPVTLAQARAKGLIEYIAFPEALRAKYQPYTLADLTKLRKAGYDSEALMVEQGVDRYVQWLSAKQA